MSQNLGKAKTSENPLLLKIACENNQNKWLIVTEVGKQNYHPGFEDYIQSLQLLPKIANAPNLCVVCFCLINNSQRALHECFQINAENVKTPSKFSSAKNLIVLSKLHNNHKTESNFEMIRMIRMKPLEAKQKSRKTPQITKSTPEIMVKATNSSSTIEKHSIASLLKIKYYK